MNESVYNDLEWRFLHGKVCFVTLRVQFLIARGEEVCRNNGDLNAPSAVCLIDVWLFSDFHKRGGDTLEIQPVVRCPSVLF
jgi:hypothetical protein